MCAMLISSCQDMGVDQPEETDLLQGGPGVIVPGIGVEGISLGVTVDSVERELGTLRYDYIATGNSRIWRDYSYGDSLQLSLEFCFIEDGPGIGSLDMIEIGSAYHGKTRGGIGIGSSLQSVHRVYGVPEKTQSYPDQGLIYEYYCLNERAFAVGYMDSVVNGFGIYYFVPLPADAMYPCR